MACVPEHPRPLDATPARRRFLVGATAATAVAGLAASGCGPLFKDRSDPPPPDPDIAITVGALERVDELLTAYATVVADERHLEQVLRPFSKRHEAHRAQLRARLPKGHPARRPATATPAADTATPSASGASASATAQPTRFADLQPLERQAAASLLENSLTAGATLAQVLASISACCSAHIRLLREERQ